MSMKEAWVPAKVSRNLKLIFYLGILAQAKMIVLFLMSIPECKLLAECVPVLLFTGECKIVNGLSPRTALFWFQFANVNYWSNLWPFIWS